MIIHSTVQNYLDCFLFNQNISFLISDKFETNQLRTGCSHLTADFNREMASSDDSDLINTAVTSSFTFTNPLSKNNTSFQICSYEIGLNKLYETKGNQ